MKATDDQLKAMDELSHKYRNDFMKPEIIGCTWEYFTQNVQGDEDLIDVDYHPKKLFYFGRMSAPGYLDCTDHIWDEDFNNLLITLEEMYPHQEGAE